MCSARCLVASLIFLLGSAAARGQAADIDPYLPDNSEMVLAINVRQLFDSALVQKHFAEALRRYLETEPHWRGPESAGD